MVAPNSKLQIRNSKLQTLNFLHRAKDQIKSNSNLNRIRPLESRYIEMPEISSIFKMFFIATTSITALALGLLYTYQRSLIYPSSLNGARKCTDKPSKYHLPYEEHNLRTSDGETLHSFLLLQDATAHDYTKKTVVVLCPNAGNIGHSLPIVEIFFRNFRYNVFIYSYRGYGSSTGTSTERGLKIDAETAMKFLTSQKQVANSSVILYGRSLGGAVGVYIGSRNYEFVKGIILENTFLTLRKCIPHIFPFLAKFTFLCNDIWDSENEIIRVNGDVNFLFLSATDDEIVPPDHMVNLFERCLSTKKNMIKFRGSKHNDTVTFPDYWDLVWDFIRDVEPIEK